VLSKWEPVWVIMPIKDVYSLKGKLGDFSMQSKTPQVEGKTEPRIISVKKNWKEVIDTPEFASRKDNILVALANDSKSSTELTDVLNRVDKWMANESSIYWAISQNPNASAATKLRAADLYEKSYTSGYHDKPNLPKTPQVEGKTADIIEKARIVWEKEKNNVSMMIQDHAEKIKDKWDELSKKDVRWGEMTTSYKEQRVLESVYKDIYWEDITEMNIKNYLDTKQSKKLESITKPKSSLPMSQKSEVLYSKPDLESEARKYKSAEEFISKNTYYRGEGGNDVAQWKALIAEWRHYAFNDEVYPKRFGEVKSYVAKPWAKIFDFWEMTFPEFSEKMWLKKRMYMSPSEISSILKEKWYDIIRYNWTYKSTWKPFTHIVELNRDVLIPQTKQQLTEIYNKANKSSLPMAAKSEVKYSEAVGKELEPLKEFLTKQKNYDDKFAELSVKANEIAKEYPWVMWTISEEWREIPANKKILEDLAYYKKLSQSFNELESSKKFIKQMWKMSIMERKALRNSIK